MSLFELDYDSKLLLREIAENLNRIAASLQKMNKLTEEKLDNEKVAHMRIHNQHLKGRNG